MIELGQVFAFVLALLRSKLDGAALELAQEGLELIEQALLMDGE